MRRKRIRKSRVMFLAICLGTLAGAIIHLIHTETQQKDIAAKNELQPFQVHTAHVNKNKESDMRAEVDVLEQASIKQQKILKNQKVIALTFDDGPKKGTTSLILDALEQNEAHATFFVLGCMAEKYPEQLKRIADAGQEIGNHSWSHPMLTRLPNNKIQSQINQTSVLIRQITGRQPALFRPPYGAMDANVRQYTNNMQIALWDVDPEDWKYRNTEHIVQAVMNQAADGKVILMHDIYSTSSAAAVEIIHQLTAQGYKIVSFSELQAIKRQRQSQTA